MPTYKVGVVLSAAAGQYRAGLKAAATATRQTETALSRASGTARTFGRTTDEAGRRTRRALETAAGSVRPLREGLRRTGDQGRRMGSTLDRAAGRAGRRVETLTRRYRDLRGAIRGAGDAARRTGGGGGGGTPVWQQAAGAVGALGTGAILVQSLGRVNALEQQLADVGAAAGLTADERETLRQGLNAAATDERVRLLQSRILTELKEAHSFSGELRTFAADGGRALGILSRASGAAAGDIGRLAGVVATATTDWVEGTALALSIGDVGSVPLDQMARYMGSIVAPKVAYGEALKTPEEFQDAVAAYQIAGLGAGGNAGRALAMLEAFTRIITDPDPELARRVPLYRADNITPRRFMELAPAIAAAFNQVELPKVVPDQMARQFIDAFRASGAKQQELLAARPADLKARAGETADTREAKKEGTAAGIDAAAQAVAPMLNPLYDLVADLPLGALAAASGTALLARADWRARLGSALTGTAGRGLGLFRRLGPTPAAGAGAVRMSVGTTTAGPSLTAPTAGRPLGRLAQAGSALRAASGRVTNLAGRVPGAGLVRGATRWVPALTAAIGSLSVAGSLARGRTGEAAETGAGVAGGIGGWIAGAKAGAALGAFGGPAAWATIPAGAIIGGVAGGWLGDKAGRAAAQRAFGEDEPTGLLPDAAHEPTGLLPDAALDAAGELDTLAAQADAAGRALEALRPAPLDRPHPTINQRVEIGPITIQSAADDPRAVADAVTDQVVDRVRQALADEQRRLSDTLVADPSPEGAF